MLRTRGGRASLARLPASWRSRKTISLALRSGLMVPVRAPVLPGYGATTPAASAIHRSNGDCCGGRWACSSRRYRTKPGSTMSRSRNLFRVRVSQVSSRSGPRNHWSSGTPKPIFGRVNSAGGSWAPRASSSIILPLPSRCPTQRNETRRRLEILHLRHDISAIGRKPSCAPQCAVRMRCRPPIELNRFLRYEIR